MEPQEIIRMRRNLDKVEAIIDTLLLNDDALLILQVAQSALAECAKPVAQEDFEALLRVLHEKVKADASA
jgi:hypothetical protein